jgi:localization factor PodJL
MVSEASWQTGGLSGRGAAPSAEGPMDQQSVETLLRRLVQRVEESERRYSEALGDLHARLDQLSSAARAVAPEASAEDTETFERLHDQVSSLAQRLERESSPLDDFERLGRALSGELGYGEAGPGFPPAAPDLLSELATASLRPSEPPASAVPFGYSPLDTGYSAPPPTPSFPQEDRSFPEEDHDLDKRLVEMAHRLEHSITTALPATALEALNARLDEIGNQITQALEQGPKGLTLDRLEQRLSDVAQQLSRAEAQLAKIAEIDIALNRLIERVDASPARLDEIAEKAAAETARRVAEEVKRSAATAERLDAMHHDLLAMSERSRERDDRLIGTIDAVHESLKTLVQLMEQNTPAPKPPKPKIPFAERMRRLDPQSFPAQEQLAGRPAETAAEANGAPKNRLAASNPDFEEAEAAPNFGRAQRDRLDEKAPELKREDRARPRPTAEKSDYATPDDLVAAARRAAQAAALKAEERASSSRLRRLAGDAESPLGTESQSRRKRPLLIVFAAILLVISALLLYSRLGSKPESQPAPPVAEESAPSAAGASDAAQGAGEPVAPPEPNAAPSAPPSGSSGLPLELEPSASGEAVGEADQSGNFTDVAKSFRPAAVGETIPQAQPAALKSEETPALPPGVVFAVEDGSSALQAMATPAPSPIPQSLPLPPSELGPMSLRRAAASGDPRAQYAIALRYAQGQGTPQNLVEAARWLERAAGAGLAAAQYRLGAMYERGQGVSKDLGRARSWYQAAAEKGNVKAMHNIAVNLSSRENGADYAEASKWFTEAASYGLPDSQFNLGILAEHGLGMSKDMAEAYKWFSLAAQTGDAEAGRRRDAIKFQLDAARLAEADEAVAAWTANEASAEANDVVELEEWADASPASNSSLVSRAQGLLNKLGYDAGPPDGLMGARTREAIKSFERKNGLEETGKVTVPLVTKLERLAS